MSIKMKTYVGIWIDRKKAVMVTIKQPHRSYEKDRETTITQIRSNVERKVRLSGGSRTGNAPWGPQEVSVDSKIEARQKLQLDKYYQQIIDAVNDADKILIMGPGETKQGFKKRLEKSKTMASKVAGLQTCDKMTDNQIYARVRAFFKSG
jgi:hypothetical protein